MSGPWWGKDVSPALAAAAADAAAGTGAVLPPLTEADPDPIAAELDGRREGFTPSWTSRRPDDPGVALQAVYAELHAVLATAIDDLPTKARVEHLVAAGVVRQPPRPLAAQLVFSVSDAAPGGVLVGQGFQVVGRDASGASVTFETDRSVFAIPGKLATLGSRAGGSVGALSIPVPGAPAVFPFGLAPAPGISLYLAIDAPVPPSPQIALGVTLAAVRGAPPPVSAGGLLVPPGAE